MKQIFSFTNKNEIYKKCIYAAIAHAVMVGKYDLLSEEISWDGENYLFQNMSGVRGVISFNDGIFACGIQNLHSNYLTLEKSVDECDDSIKLLFENEINPYLLLEEGNKKQAAISALFWGDENRIYSCCEEAEFMEKSDNVLLPYLYEFDDLKRYWSDYYELNGDQRELIDKLFERRLENESFSLDMDVKEKLSNWFGEKHVLCLKAFKELGII
ncbi:hypothetical protein [Butyrivibrio proteoclasticus]|uniref:hypothetical protein n=1 Tax=Butyrivibrio proteoclasticus TaxID=43305 RepID=UPI00047CDE18|nr:hypothetical protein [Butyrivibrio proteoclasticus]